MDNVIQAADRFIDLPESELIRQLKLGDRMAFQQLYQLHVGRVYGLCFRLLGDKSTAEDVTQEVFIQVWHKIANFQQQSRFSTWLHAVATNIALTHYRKRKTWWQRFVSAEEQSVPEPSQADDVQQHGLEALIQRLPDQARMVFVLFAVEGYRHEEIAEQLDIAVGSSKAHYHRARNLLKAWIDNE